MPSLSEPGQGRARAILGASVIFLVLPPIFVALRVWARRLKKTPLCVNDFAIFAALLFTTGYNVMSIISMPPLQSETVGTILTDVAASIEGGYGQHIYTLSLEELAVQAKSTVAATLLWPTANLFVKVSVLLFYVKIFRNQRMAIAAYAIGAMTLAYWLATVVTALAICRPFAYNWNKITIDGSCGDLMAYYLSTGIVNLIIDVIIVALPLPLLWGLQMRPSKKLQLTAIFSLGALICIISIVRVIAIKRLDITGDVTYDIVLDNICTSLEPTLGVINACLPILQPVVSKVSLSAVFGGPKSWSWGGGSSRGKIWSKTSYKTPMASRSNKSHPLPVDLYPLTDLTGTQSHISGQDRRAVLEKDRDSLNDDLENHKGIKVKQYVGVYSTSKPGS